MCILWPVFFAGHCIVECHLPLRKCGFHWLCTKKTYYSSIFNQTQHFGHDYLREINEIGLFQCVFAIDSHAFFSVTENTPRQKKKGGGCSVRYVRLNAIFAVLVQYTRGQNEPNRHYFYYFCPIFSSFFLLVLASDYTLCGVTYIVDDSIKCKRNV